MVYEVIICAIVLALLIYKIEQHGRAATENKQMQKVLDDIHEASLVRDKLRHDLDDAERVRERFTRELL